jgi:hypothetical protein
MMTLLTWFPGSERTLRINSSRQSTEYIVGSITEPLLLKSMTNDQLWQIVDDAAHHLTVPCHTKAVERHVKLVTEASLAVSSMDRRNGSIRVKIHLRSKLPKFDIRKIFLNKGIIFKK